MTLDKTKAKIRDMFDAIAPTYDKLNHILSLNADKKWRKKAVHELLLNNPKHILDVATGSGDMVLEILKQGNYQITAIDISTKMIEIAKHKITNKKLAKFIVSSAEHMPFADNMFDGVTVAFGVRNFEQLEIGLNEIKRVLKTGGHLIILEFVKPQNKLTKTFIGFYLKYLLPLIGKWVSKNKEAYRYLNQSINEFYKRCDFENICIRVGFQKIKTKVLFMGLVAIFVLKKI